MSETFTRGYRVIFLFENEKALAQFTNSGSSGSAQSDAGAKRARRVRTYSRWLPNSEVWSLK
jgi:hypothetical protein